MAHNRFDLDLADGEFGEDLVRSLFDGRTKVEVKTDLKSLKTGNVFVETHAHGEPSAISITDADYWATVVGTRVVFIPVPQLKAMLPYGAKAKGGDNMEFDGVLLRLPKLLSMFNVDPPYEGW